MKSFSMYELKDIKMVNPQKQVKILCGSDSLLQVNTTVQQQQLPS